jgi:hypothetical protein
MLRYSPKRNTISSARNWARVRRAEQHGRNSSLTCWNTVAQSERRHHLRRKQPQAGPSRRYSPEFWRDKCEAFRLIQDVKQVPAQEATAQLPTAIQRSGPLAGATVDAIRACSPLIPQQTAQRQSRDHVGFASAGALDCDAPALFREGHIRLRVCLPHSDLPVSRPHRDVSQSDQQRRRHHSRPARLQRERNIKVRLSYYVASKTLTLAVFALAQCVLFVLIGNSVLQIRGMFWIDLAIMFMTAMSGVALGLVISSLVADPKTAANIVPLVLIPQIIMGGALIKYEDMNRNLAPLYSMSHWFSEHPNPDKTVKTEANCGPCLPIHRDALVL